MPRSLLPFSASGDWGTVRCLDGSARVSFGTRRTPG
uniref:Uncharacterized protein n=1 Tax=Arundo donax TaxID=35708 RepID=A0A0A9EDX6_ARUDO